MNTSEPKPCPFCGGRKLRVMSRSDYYELVGEHGSACVVITCEICHLNMYEYSISIKNYEKKVEKLIKKWNWRVGSENA